jgi:hypothetical protein
MNISILTFFTYKKICVIITTEKNRQIIWYIEVCMLSKNKNKIICHYTMKRCFFIKCWKGSQNWLLFEKTTNIWFLEINHHCYVAEAYKLLLLI